MTSYWKLASIALAVSLALPCVAQTGGTWDPAVGGDGAVDNTVTIQQALDDAGKAGGGIVRLPAGRFRVNGTLKVPANVTLQGVYRVPPTAINNHVAEMSGSVLLAYAGRGEPNGDPFIRLAGRNASVTGFVIAYPEWKQTDVPPVPYPPCILSEDTENVAIQDCCLLNPYEAIKLIRAHRHLVRNITGYPSKRGIFVDECYDIGHIENIHFWPFGVSYNPKNPYCLWVNTKGVAFELGRTDWHYVSNTFCFGYGIGYRFSQTKTGSTNGNFLGLGADSCQRAVYVEQCQPPGLLITNGEFVGRWSSSDSVCVEVGANAEGTVSLVNCSFWGPIDRCVWMHARNGQLTASACHFVSWDVRLNRTPAVQLDAGRAIVQGCTFGDGDVTVGVGPRVRSAILTGNQATNGFTVDNRAGNRMLASLNETGVTGWSASERSHYRLTIGGDNDGPFLRGWHGRERPIVSGKPRPMRWSTTDSKMHLPVQPGKPYTVTFEAEVPAAALAPDAGIYLDNRRIISFKKAGSGVFRSTIPSVKSDCVTLTVRCRCWIPSKVSRGSNDDRLLGVQAYAVTMQAKDVAGRTYDANAGRFLP